MNCWVVTHGDGAALRYVSNERGELVEDIKKARRFLRPSAAATYVVNQPPRRRVEMKVVAMLQEVFA